MLQPIRMPRVHAPGPTHAGPPVRIFLARHAESVLNALGRVQGWADSPLTDRGRAEAHLLGLAVRAAGARLVAAHCADMLRHRQTADVALAAAGSRLVPEPDARLRELAFGRFEGAANAKLWRALAADRGRTGRKESRPPGDRPADADGDGEGGELDVLAALDAVRRLSADSGLPAEGPDEVRERILAGLTTVTRQASAAGGGDVLVVSSGLTIMLALQALGVDRRAFAGGIGNAALSVLVWDGGAWTVERANDGADA